MLLLLFIFLLVSEILITEFAQELSTNAIVFGIQMVWLDITVAPVGLSILILSLYLVRCVQMDLLCISLERAEHDFLVVASGIAVV